MQSGSKVTPQLWALMELYAEAPALDWLHVSVASLKAADDLENELGMLLAVARRKVGDGGLDDRAPELIVGELRIAVCDWLLAEVARNLLLQEAVVAAPSGEKHLVSAAFRMGDEAERASIARGLALLPGAMLHKPIALEIGRINSMRLFTSLALCNPYPSVVYSDHEFNQLVLKSLFNMLPVEKIIGLRERANPELSRMCADYVQERRDAGRAVPVNIWLALAPFADEQGKQFLLDYAASEEPNHRRFCGVAMVGCLAEHPEFRGLIEERLAMENDRSVADAIRAAMV